MSGLEFVPGMGFRKRSDAKAMNIGIQRVECRAGDIVFQEGDLPTHAYVLLEGDVRILGHDADGRVIPMADIPKGALFGELSILTNKARTASAATRNGCKLLAIGKSDLLRTVDRADPVLRYWITYLCHRVVELTERIEQGE